MSSSLFTKPSPPVTTSRQLPQHPKMRLSYILNPAPPRKTTVAELMVPEQVPLLEEPVSALPCAPCPEGFSETITQPRVAELSSDLLETCLSHNPTPLSPTSSDHELPRESQPGPRSCSPSLLASGDFIPHPNSYIHDFPSDLNPRLSYNSTRRPNTYPDSRNAFGTASAMNRAENELVFTPDGSGIHHPLRPSPLQSRDFNTTQSSSTGISQPLPRHPKMALSYILNPSPTVGEAREAEPGLDHTKPVPFPSSRSPSPSLSDSEVNSPSTSDFNFNGSPVDSQYPRSDSSSHDEQQLPSPATTPPSSPPPVPHAIPDLPQMVQPPQHLPWEGAPPPGLNAATHRAYQRAGVHWMLAEIFGPDIG